ncbi:MAG: hypothetical protein DRR16_13920 [Candidatus Parabeggiatoa sp. nov. 3]|nr:MAG: hypothetical protein DRR00_03470 [Gammaproteobacteria bacterium]RKZ59117.1 MAG: hypothetical protein DRQ99_24265 [Gammaproteobacteria bacterium]RKZ84732.1 MAG: hypothetical protein DRR16_13920 [Gammaproteobacteria bacterium]
MPKSRIIPIAIPPYIFLNGIFNGGQAGNEIFNGIFNGGQAGDEFWALFFGHSTRDPTLHYN